MTEDKRYWWEHFSFVNFYTVLVTALIFGLIFCLIFVDIPADKLLQLGDIKTALLTLLATVISFWFGSSKSTKARDEVVNKAINDGMKGNTVAGTPEIEKEQKENK